MFEVAVCQGTERAGEHVQCEYLARSRSPTDRNVVAALRAGVVKHTSGAGGAPDTFLFDPCKALAAVGREYPAGRSRSQAMMRAHRRMIALGIAEDDEWDLRLTAFGGRVAAAAVQLGGRAVALRGEDKA